MTFYSPKTWTHFELRPYASYEWFFDFDLKRHNHNRTIAGLEIPLRPDINLNLYYLRQSVYKTSLDWTGKNILGSEVVVRFGKCS